MRQERCECGSYAINHGSHGRDGSDGHLCDVCYWKFRAEGPPPAELNPLIWSVFHSLTKAKTEMDGWAFASGYRLIGEALDQLNEIGYLPGKEDNGLEN